MILRSLYSPTLYTRCWTNNLTHTKPTLLWLCLMSPFSIGSANWKPQLRWYKIWDTSRVESSCSLQWINSSRKPKQAAVWAQSSLVLLHLSVFGRKLFHSVILPAWIFSFVDSPSFSLLFTSWIHLSYNSFSPLVHLSHHWITESTSLNTVICNILLFLHCVHCRAMCRAILIQLQNIFTLTSLLYSLHLLIEPLEYYLVTNIV